MIVCLKSIPAKANVQITIVQFSTSPFVSKQAKYAALSRNCIRNQNIVHAMPQMYQCINAQTCIINQCHKEFVCSSMDDPAGITLYWICSMPFCFRLHWLPFMQMRLNLSSSISSTHLLSYCLICYKLKPRLTLDASSCAAFRQAVPFVRHGTVWKVTSGNGGWMPFVGRCCIASSSGYKRGPLIALLACLRTKSNYQPAISSNQQYHPD